ncbi:MAG: MoxR-like ATPase [Actinomycetota bacterium]
MEVRRFKEAFDRIAANVNGVIHGKDDVVRMALVAVFADGHVLFEDVPGVGKSMLARALSMTMGAQSSRIQCTPDMLPGDITGSTIVEAKTMKFSFRPGPVFTNVLLVDEINRATPKTQSALLECMAERTVTIDGVSHELPQPFLVLATQNPVEQAGTFPLPEAQLDRFLFKLRMDYPDEAAERLVIRGNLRGLEVKKTKAVTSVDEILAMQAVVESVTLPEAVESYIIQVVNATRNDPAILLAASPRASITLAKASSVMAAADGRDTVYPEDVRALLRPVLAHRIMLTPDAILRGESVEDVLDRITNRVKPPLGMTAPAPESTMDVTANGTKRRRKQVTTGS